MITDEALKALGLTREQWDRMVAQELALIATLHSRKWGLL